MADQQIGNENETLIEKDTPLTDELEARYPTIADWLRDMEANRESLLYWAQKVPGGVQKLEARLRLWNEEGRQDATWQEVRDLRRMIAHLRKCPGR
jgi:hypothetical protein